LPLGTRPARKTRGIFVSFATLVIVGFGLAGWYVSTRILAAEAQAAAMPAQAVQPAQSLPVVVTVSQTPPAGQPDAQTVLPLALEYYLQIATLGTADDAKYLKQLEDRGYHAQLEPTAAGHDARILIGPYPDERSLQHARANLTASGILAIEYVR